MRKKIILLLLLCINYRINITEAQNSSLQDTVKLSLEDAETYFLKNNFELLAAKYQIKEADASLIQSKLWDNPSLSIDKEAYNDPSKKIFFIPQGGEYDISVQQLIYLAGKRNKRINIERINTQIAKYQFYDLMRTLRYELRTTFFELYFSQQSISVYDRELAALKTLVDAYTTEYQKGNVAFNELARIQALQFDLENDKIEVLKDLTEKQGDLILLTGDTLARPIKPNLDVSSFDNIDISSLNYTKLLDSGLVNRYDLKITETQIQSEQTNLALQKAMRIPDLTLGANYDRIGGYIPNYNSITLSFDLPVWNHNQGNIKIAENQIEESKTNNKQKELEVKNEITKAFVQLIETDKLYKSSIQKFNGNYDKLFDGINIAYQNHTINLLEFIDYYETYKNSKSEYYQLQNNRLGAIEDLNMATGLTIIK